MKRLLLGMIPLGGIAVAVMANRRRRELQPELPEHRTVRLLGHEVEALTNRLRDLATRTPDVQRLISDVEELRADVRRLAGEVEEWKLRGNGVIPTSCQDPDYDDLDDRLRGVEASYPATREAVTRVQADLLRTESVSTRSRDDIKSFAKVMYDKLEALEERLAKLERQHILVPSPTLDPGIGGGAIR